MADTGGLAYQWRFNDTNIPGATADALLLTNVSTNNRGERRLRFLLQRAANCALGGTTAGTGYGQLQVSGTVTLNGALSVDLTNGFSPALNDSFTVLIAGTRNGTFAGFSYPSSAVTMQLSNTTSSVIVRVTDVVTTIPRPLLLPPEISGADFKLTWTAVSNTSYRVEFNLDLAPSNWAALPGDVIGVSNTASKLDALTPSNRLYRVCVLP